MSDSRLSFLVPPHGGELVDLIATGDRHAELLEASREMPDLTLTTRQLCDLELLLCGGFSPLRGFLGREDYDGVVRHMRLADGTLWPMPITLGVDEATDETMPVGTSVALRDAEGVLVAVLHVEESWKPDREADAEAVFGTRDPNHPGVDLLVNQSGTVNLAGRLEGVQLPPHYDYRSLRDTPAELRAWANERGWRKIVAFQTRNPMHRAHFELTLRAAKELQANLLIHPVVGRTQPGDLDHFTRVRCYQAILGRFPQPTVKLSLLPLSMRMGGPREALWHAIIRKNYGASHFIVGRDHASPRPPADGEPYYGPYDAQDLLREHGEELGISMVPFREFLYVEARDEYLPSDEIPEGMQALRLSGTELRRRLAEGRSIPEWFTFPEVADELRRRHPPAAQRGFTLFFTGLSGAGKSTLANALQIKLLELGDRPVTLLDGDIVRKNLSSELGFSREHRDLNVHRIGFVASEITKNRGIALCAPIAPYDRVRKEVRRMVEDVGTFLLIHVATPLEVCETRDRKGLYAKARAGIVKNFTGISDPYEEPDDAEMVLDTSRRSVSAAVQDVLLLLEQRGLLGARIDGSAPR